MLLGKSWLGYVSNTEEKILLLSPLELEAVEILGI